MTSYSRVKEHLKNCWNCPAPLRKEKPSDLSEKKKMMLFMKETPYTLINEWIYKFGLDDVLKICALEHEHKEIIEEAHLGPTMGHLHVDTMVRKILQEGLWWLTLNMYCWLKINKCDKCQGLGWPLKRDEIPLMFFNPRLPFEIWPIEFVGPFLGKG